MDRKIYVIPAGSDPEVFAAAAAAAGANEIAVGIPPALADQLDGAALPAVYTEPDPDLVPTGDPPVEPDPGLDPALVQAWEKASTIAQLRAAGAGIFAALGVST